MLIPSAARVHYGCVIFVRILQGLVEVWTAGVPSWGWHVNRTSRLSLTWSTNKHFIRLCQHSMLKKIGKFRHSDILCLNKAEVRLWRLAFPSLEQSGIKEMFIDYLTEKKKGQAQVNMLWGKFLSLSFAGDDPELISFGRVIPNPCWTWIMIWVFVKIFHWLHSLGM